MPRPDHHELSITIHKDNITAGWWHDIETGEPLDRNIGELLCLVHSELSEGYGGFALSINDDKLPHLPMMWVEVGDACIRAYDILGHYDNVKCSFLESEITDLPAGWITIQDTFLVLHSLVSMSMEGFRKSNIVKGKMHLIQFLDECFKFADRQGVDLLSIISQKRLYNKQRADHKPENRRLSDGKKW